MNQVLGFITKRPLWVNIMAAVVFMVMLLFLFVYSLNFITKHGKSKNVPDIVGKKLTDAERLLGDQGFGLIIVDSVYVDTLPPLSVIRQVPEGDAVVKIDRDVYVTVNRAVPPIIEMPNLVGFSYRSAVLQLQNLGLRVGDTSSREYFAKNSVLEQRYRGTEIRPGTKLQMGSSIDLVLGNGVSDVQIAVPSLLGLTYNAARQLMEGRGVSLFVANAPGVIDSSIAYIYKQDPEQFNDDGRRNTIRPGQMIDIWLQKDKPETDTTHVPQVPFP